MTISKVHEVQASVAQDPVTRMEELRLVEKYTHNTLMVMEAMVQHQQAQAYIRAVLAVRSME